MKTQNGRQYDFVKNGGRVFFVSDGYCAGYADTEKSNLNVCKFVQSARNMGSSGFPFLAYTVLYCSNIKETLYVVY